MLGIPISKVWFGYQAIERLQDLNIQHNELFLSTFRCIKTFIDIDTDSSPKQLIFQNQRFQNAKDVKTAIAAQQMSIEVTVPVNIFDYRRECCWSQEDGLSQDVHHLLAFSYTSTSCDRCWSISEWRIKSQHVLIIRHDSTKLRSSGTLCLAFRWSTDAERQWKQQAGMALNRPLRKMKWMRPA